MKQSILKKSSSFQHTEMMHNNEINQDLNDLFNPQGCWSPTFKASFHNINALLNFVLFSVLF